MKIKFNSRVATTLFSLVFIVVGALLAIEYAQGNFRLTKTGFVAESGLLAANSFPPGAQIFIDEKLVSATDDTIYLEPGEYQVKIVKDGYWPWEKRLNIEKELVTQTNAQLFPTTPSLTPLTFTGVDNPHPSPDGQKIAYYSASASSTLKNGIYILEINNNLLSLQKGARQITDDPSEYDLSSAEMIWSPDSTQLMLITDAKQVLLDINKKNELSTLPDVSFSRKQILQGWEEEMYIREREYLGEFPNEVIALATQSAKNVYISPDKKRLLYTATQAVTLSEGLIPPVPATNNQAEQRSLVTNGIYVYDREEDKNFYLGQDESGNESHKNLLATDLHNRIPTSLSSSPSAFVSLQASTSAKTAENYNIYHTPLYLNSYQWYPDSKHIIYTRENSIQIKAYDNTNDTNVYSGPFLKEFVYPWPDGNKLVIMTSFNPDSPENFYAIEMK